MKTRGRYPTPPPPAHHQDRARDPGTMEGSRNVCRDEGIGARCVVDGGEIGSIHVGKGFARLPGMDHRDGPLISANDNVDMSEVRLAA